MKEIELEFVTNANKTGDMTFKRVKQGVAPNGRNVYIYSRTKMDGTFFSYEVIVPKVKKAGTYNLPPKGSGKTITYAEDFEEYPGAKTGFGHYAWEIRTLTAAEAKFKLLTQVAIEIPEEDEEDEPATTASVNEPVAPKHRGRQKGPRPVLTLPPVGELFSVKELAAQNKVEYIVADVFRKEALGKTIQFVKTERRNVKGPETSLYTAMAPAWHLVRGQYIYWRMKAPSNDDYQDKLNRVNINRLTRCASNMPVPEENLTLMQMVAQATLQGMIILRAEEKEKAKAKPEPIAQKPQILEIKLGSMSPNPFVRARVQVLNKMDDFHRHEIEKIERGELPKSRFYDDFVKEVAALGDRLSNNT